MTQSHKAEELNPRTLDESYRLTIQALDASSRDTSSIDTKLFATFAVATVIIGLLPLLEGVAIFTSWRWSNLFLYLGLIAFLWILVWVHWGLRGRTYYSLESLEPRVLREHYWQLEEVRFKKAIYAVMEGAHKSNRLQLRHKYTAYRRSAVAVPVELIFLLAWTFTRGI